LLARLLGLTLGGLPSATATPALAAFAFVRCNRLAVDGLLFRDLRLAFVLLTSASFAALATGTTSAAPTPAAAAAAMPLAFATFIAALFVANFFLVFVVLALERNLDGVVLVLFLD
jgi:hypothetical protein